VTELRLHSRHCVLGDSPGTYRVVPARVVIRDGVIVDVVSGVDAPSQGDHELGEQILAPAFVNAHTHLALHACRGLARPEMLEGNLVEDLFYAVERHLEAEDVEAFARVAALECLLQGVGTVFDHYYHGVAVARAARDCGLAAVIAPTLQDLSGPGASSWEQALSETAELDADPWKQQGIVAAVGPHATDTVSGKLWRRAVDLAIERDLVLHAHVAQSAGEARRSLDEYGCSPIAWLRREGLLPEGLRQLLVHALLVSQEDLGQLDPVSHVLGANPYSQMQFGYPAPVREWMEAGLDWFVGTDCGASNDSMDVQKELRLISGQSTWSVTWSAARRDLRAGLDADRVDSVEQERRIAAATGAILRDPRQLLHRVWGAPGTWHPALRTGVIEAGARAQLCVYDAGHPALWPGRDLLRGLALGGIAPALTGVIASGEWVGEPGNPAACLRDPVVREWMQEASRRHELLLERAGIGS